MSLGCMLRVSSSGSRLGERQMLMGITAAVIAKYQGPEMEKPAIRPYTPVSDEGQQYTPLHVP